MDKNRENAEGFKRRNRYSCSKNSNTRFLGEALIPYQRRTQAIYGC